MTTEREGQWFAYCPEAGLSLFGTWQEARDAAKEHLESWAEYATDYGWDGSEQAVCWGRVTGFVTETYYETTPEPDAPDYQDFGLTEDAPALEAELGRVSLNHRRACHELNAVREQRDALRATVERVTALRDRWQAAGMSRAHLLTMELEPPLTPSPEDDNGR